MLEYDTTPNPFRDQLAIEPLDLDAQIKTIDGFVSAPARPGIGVEPDLAFLKKYATE